MKHLKKYNDYNESLKNKLATGLLGLGMAACTTPSNDVVAPNTIQQTEVSKPNSSNDIELPNSFEIDQDIISIGNDFHIGSDAGSCGVIEQRIFSWGTTFEYMRNDTSIAIAKERVLSWGTNIDVYDANNNKIGSIEEEILESMFSVYTKFSIKDGDGNIIGKSKKLDFIGTDITIYDNDGNVVATMERPMINLLSDSWSIKISSDVIDKRILVFIPCYKTQADDEREDEEKKKNNDD